MRGVLKLFERLPDSITVDGKRYKCNFDFRNVLKMIEIMQRDDILPGARDYLCAKCVCNAPKNASKVFAELCSVLFPDAPKTDEKRITSYEQDAALIRSAFLQVYGVNLWKENLHWFEFRELLQNLPEGNRYAETLSIRARPMPAPNKYNAKEREWLMQAKQAVALHLTDAEQAKKYEHDVSRVFSGILGMISKGGGTNGK